MYHIISSAENESLVFPKDAKALYDEFKKERLALIRKYKTLVRQKYGIYASNQDKFVKRISDLNQWDSCEYI